VRKTLAVGFSVIMLDPSKENTPMPNTHNLTFSTFVKLALLAAIGFGASPHAAEQVANKEAEVLYDDFERGHDTDYVGLRISEQV
jgi:hypothetical protein